MSNEQKQNGIWTPAFIQEMVDIGVIKKHEMRMVSIIKAYSSTELGCFTSDAFLAQMTCVSDRQIRKNLNRLSAEGVLIIENKGNRKRILRLAEKWDNYEKRNPEPGTDATSNKPGTRNSSTGFDNPEPGTRNPEPGTGTRNSSTGFDNPEPGTTVPKTRNHSSAYNICINKEEEREEKKNLKKKKNMSGFDLLENKPKQETPPDYPMFQFDNEVAKRLYISAKKKHGEKHPSIKNMVKAEWVNQVREMREDDERSPEKIKRLLDYYLENTDKPSTPRINTVLDFREKFNWLENLCRNDIQFIGAGLEINEQVGRAFNRIKGLGWPQNSIQDLQLAMQISWNRYKAVWDAIAAFSKAYGDGRCYHGQHEVKRLILLANWLCPGKMTAATEYTELHFQEFVFPKVAKWHNWDGNLVPFLIDTKTKNSRFNLDGCNQAQAFNNESVTWFKLMDQIKNEGYLNED